MVVLGFEVTHREAQVWWNKGPYECWGLNSGHSVQGKYPIHCTVNCSSPRMSTVLKCTGYYTIRVVLDMCIPKVDEKFNYEL